MCFKYLLSACFVCTYKRGLTSMCVVVCVSCGCVCVSCGGVVVGGRGTSEKKLLAGRSIRPAMMDRPDQINDWTKALHPSDGTPPPTLSTKKYYFQV